jgi:hypothetical protein
MVNVCVVGYNTAGDVHLIIIIIRRRADCPVHHLICN